MGTIHIKVQFLEHMALDRIDSMSGTFMACGSVAKGPGEREFLVEVRRPKSLAHLEETLFGWDRAGYVRWSRL